MLELGKFNTLKINRESPHGLFLGHEEGEVLLPNKWTPENYKIGDPIEVFIYTDSEDRVIATTLSPIAELNEMAVMEIIDTKPYGAFANWGLEKDLLIPKSEQLTTLQKGEKAVVRVCYDYKTDRLIGSTKIKPFLEKEVEGIQEKQKVEAIVFSFTQLGAQVVVNNKFLGLIYANEIFQPLQVGDVVEAYVTKVREDGKIDISLRGSYKEEIDDDKSKVLQKLNDSNGFLPFNDNSSPEEIKESFHMSKKSFKKAIGNLYREKVIEIKDDGIYLLK